MAQPILPTNLATNLTARASETLYRAARELIANQPLVYTEERMGIVYASMVDRMANPHEHNRGPYTPEEMAWFANPDSNDMGRARIVSLYDRPNLP